MAIVPINQTTPFHMVVREVKIHDPWVVQNVIPKMDHGAPEWGTYEDLQTGLHAWIEDNSVDHVVADWPDDLIFLLKALIKGPGKMLPLRQLKLDLVTYLDYTGTHSRVPHNALEDALALKKLYLEYHA